MSDENVMRFEWSEIEAEEVFPGITRQAISGHAGTVVRYTYYPGCVFPTHSHPESQITVIHSGEIEFDIEGQRQVLRGGQVATIAGDVPHGARVTGDEVVVTDNYFASANRSNLQFNEAN